MNVFVQVGVKSGTLLRENEPFFLLLGRRRARSIGKGPPSRNGGYSICGVCTIIFIALNEIFYIPKRG